MKIKNKTFEIELDNNELLVIRQALIELQGKSINTMEDVALNNRETARDLLKNIFNK